MASTTPTTYSIYTNSELPIQNICSNTKLGEEESLYIGIKEPEAWMAHLWPQLSTPNLVIIIHFNQPTAFGITMPDSDKGD
jgi:hypothetical protein